jgi:hypothetical protein
MGCFNNTQKRQGIKWMYNYSLVLGCMELIKEEDTYSDTSLLHSKLPLSINLTSYNSTLKNINSCADTNKEEKENKN